MYDISPPARVSYPSPEHAQWNAQLAAFNAAIPFLLEGFVAGGGNAVYVDMAQAAAPCGLAGGCCPGGGVHPTVVGYDAMARVWADALQLQPGPDEPGRS